MTLSPQGADAGGGANEIARRLMAQGRADAQARSTYLDSVMRSYLDRHGQPGRFAVVQYRCRRRRCRLAWIVLDPASGEPFVIVFGHRYSPEAARRRTAGGRREWPDHAQAMTSDSPAVQLACDHVHGAVTVAELHAAYAQARSKGSVTLSYNGTEGA